MDCERKLKNGWIVSGNRMFGIDIVNGQIVILSNQGQIPAAPWWV